MECRCYRGGDGRTRMKQLHLSLLDWISTGVVAVVFTAAIVMNLFLPAML